MSLVLDAGAFVAVEKGDRDVAALFKLELLGGRVPTTHAGVVGQVWRGGAGKQVPVALLLAATHVVPLDEALGRRAGLLLGLSKQTDVVDAAVVLLARDGDTILTSNPGDLAKLAARAAIHADVVGVRPRITSHRGAEPARSISK